MTSRRGFLKQGGIALFGVGLMGGIPAFLAEAAASGNKIINPFQRRKIMVTIFQRGAMDGLMAVTPFTDENLKKARPTLFMTAAQGGKTKPLIDLDGRFGLHPSMAAFEPLFREKRLGIVHGIGSPNNTRSHFDAQDYMEAGTPFNKGTASGWLNRAVGLLGHEAATPFQAVSLTSSMPRSFYGDNPSVSISNLQDFDIQMGGNKNAANMAAKSFEDLYGQATSSLLKETGKESFDAVKMLQKNDVRNYRPAAGVAYPNTALGNSLKQIAQLIKMDVGLEIAFAESGGWDTHFNQGTENGPFARNVADLSNSIVAFWSDISQYQDDVTLMTMTEFGRTVAQNGTGGTDHGRASCNFILGNDVNGGLVHGDMKPLIKENLEDGRDLAVTTDFRAVFSEVADKHLKINNDKKLFPDWKGEKIGVMKA
ncbi:DUF1501 domain-containing protein [Mucilaginibacter myungsuensis]|uniref:DUF1501 domain-containing protein n=1 Tax=Mucilaginibacter myungsuensis TaxID=649104 RepID=A0A929PUA8_9SPHI|nr:DUF1501 domain-containing protein [Mucilaginibacter myungsuensis]MBE9660543.1 DUF1501 domain-containing protein [Mucilaginibacter myungsuensis]MDN3600588.1 DUF1501 domain-containing protein [Mucilaginibacter myungsuensis]